MHDVGGPTEVLYPPIDDEEEESATLVDNNRDKNSEITSNSSSTNSNPTPPSSSAVAARRSSSTIVMSHQLASNFEALKKRKVDQLSITDQHRALAESTAHLAVSEIERMQRAVAELEARLLNGEHDEEQDLIPQVVVVAAHHDEVLAESDEDDDDAGHQIVKLDANGDELGRDACDDETTAGADCVVDEEVISSAVASPSSD